MAKREIGSKIIERGNEERGREITFLSIKSKTFLVFGSDMYFRYKMAEGESNSGSRSQPYKWFSAGESWNY